MNSTSAEKYRIVCLIAAACLGGIASPLAATDDSTPNVIYIMADEETIASMLKKRGYATGGFGKWGCGGRDSTGVPENHGFDVFLGYYDQVHAHTYYPPYLYWEIGGWKAIRQGQWRAVRPKARAAWELYDLEADPSEPADLSATNPEILDGLKKLAASAHEPVREGTFTSTDRHERDRQSKLRKQDEPAPDKEAII